MEFEMEQKNVRFRGGKFHGTSTQMLGQGKVQRWAKHKDGGGKES